ncbi:MAG: TetR family transcriptional regulator [Acidimicrobiia bacterium]|nr:TetR family transcriptional regulator [Acidimicrobiia bacterium]
MPDGGVARSGIPTQKHRAGMHPTKRSILDAAVGLFGKKGYAATGVQAIVDEAGITKGAFYHHFTGKEDLLKDIHDDFIDYYIDLLDSIQASARSPREVFTRYLEVFFLTLDEFRAEMTIFYQERRFLSGATFADVRRKRDLLERNLVAVIEDGIAVGQFRPLASPELMLFGMVGLSVHIATWYRPNEVPLEALGQMVREVLLHGLLAEPLNASTRGSA